MKKIVGTIAAVALVAASAFADVGIGSWGRTIWETVSNINGTTGSYLAPSWGGPDKVGRVGISIHGESENVGFNIDMNADNGTIGVGDTAYFWAKPWSWLEVKIGKVQDDTGRGNQGYGIFNWQRGITACGWVGEDVTFTRFGAANGFTQGGQANGAILKITPIEGLWIIAAFDIVGDDPSATAAPAGAVAKVNPAQSAPVDAYWNKASYGAGYTIANVGNIKAKVAGGKVINAAFDLTAVENLDLSVGAFIPLKTSEAFTAAVTANFKAGIAAIHAMYTFTSGANWNFGGYNMNFGVGADFDFGNGIGLNADVRGNIGAGSAFGLGFLAGLTKGLSNGMIGIGFEGGIAGNAFTFAVPVVVSAWF